ncbi:MAG: class II aldolase/adducin family protein [Candidatus Omnitrophota bacterium]|nr:MAG: class II aldolase/adducin family protein [Candidatus Omnitrophota bacterium]
MNREKELKREIIDIGKRLYDFRLVAARGGNLSARIENDLILITSSGSSLGELQEENILKVDLSSSKEVKGLTTEFPLHSLIYQSFPAKRIIHCHPPLVNAYYAVYEKLESITFENRLFLGEVPQVRQETPAITQPEKVIEALKTNNIVVIKNHGVVCMSDSFNDAFYLIEELEEAVKMAGLARILSKEKPNIFEEELKKTLKESSKSYTMFSREHILTIVKLINQDEAFLSKAKELGLTAQVAIKLDGDNTFKFNFQEGRIKRVDFDDNAPFVISGGSEAWRLIFEGRLDPFVATTQGKLKLKGELGKLSRWYVPFTRMFSLFKEVKIQ